MAKPLSISFFPPGFHVLKWLAKNQASESDIQRAFRGGDNDDDDGLSLSEAGNALRKLSGKTVDSSTIKAACNSCGVDLNREMSCK